MTIKTLGDSIRGNPLARKEHIAYIALGKDIERTNTASSKAIELVNRLPKPY